METMAALMKVVQRKLEKVSPPLTIGVFGSLRLDLEPADNFQS